jgi:hypothetical protein
MSMSDGMSMRESSLGMPAVQLMFKLVEVAGIMQLALCDLTL